MNIRAVAIVLLILMGYSQTTPSPTTQHTFCPTTVPKAVDISDLRRYIQSYEGLTNMPIKVQGRPTIGIGFDMASNIKYFRRLNLGDFPTCLTGIEIDSIFKWIMVERVIPSTQDLISNLDSQPLSIQYMMYHMTYMLGDNGFEKWHKFRKAIVERNYKLAGTIYKKSDMYNQVSHKTRQYYEVLNSLLHSDK